LLGIEEEAPTPSSPRHQMAAAMWNFSGTNADSFWVFASE
jgi:hypothetical protein